MRVLSLFAWNFVFYWRDIPDGKTPGLVPCFIVGGITNLAQGSAFLSIHGTIGGSEQRHHIKLCSNANYIRVASMVCVKRFIDEAIPDASLLQYQVS
jgi:hypothetical protein